MIEDAVRDLLADRAEHARLGVDGRAMLERVAHRQRVRMRARVLAAAATVGLLVAGGAVWQSRPVQGGVDVAISSVPTPRATPRASSSQSTRTVTWGSIRFDVPSDWKVNDTHEVFPHPSNALTWGPFIGTLRTGPMCSSNSDGSGGCSRSYGILDRRPTNGVVAWLDAGEILKTLPGGGISGSGDPGPGADGVCPRGGTTFHAFRTLTVGEGTYRVVVDGCAYGPRRNEYLAKLTEVAHSVRRS